MDPERNLEEQLDLAERLLEDFDEERDLDEHDVARLCELVLALDDWIRAGGFLPRKWKRKR